MKTSVIEVHDMLSVWSVDEVEKRIGEVPGVESVTVNYAAKNATVRYDETRLQVADIKSAVRQSGYESAGESLPTPKATSASAPTPAPTASAGEAPQVKAAPGAPPSTPVAAAPKPAAAAASAPAASLGDGKKDKAAPSIPAAAASKSLPDAPVAAPGATPAGAKPEGKS